LQYFTINLKAAKRILKFSQNVDFNQSLPSTAKFSNAKQVQDFVKENSQNI